MEGKFAKILKQAYYLTKGFRFFWLLGLFLVWLNLFRGSMVIFEFSKKLGVSDEMQGMGQLEPVPGFANPWTGVVALIFVGLVAIYYYRSKGALIVAVSQLRNKKSIDKKRVYEDSEPHTVQLMKLGFGLTALLLIITALLISPVAYLSSNEYSSRATMLGTMALLIYIPIFAILYYTMVFAPMFIIAQNMTIGNSIRASLDLIKKYWTLLVVFSITLIAIELIALIVSVLIVGVCLLPFVLLLNVFYDMGGQNSLILLEGLAGITGFVVFFILQGFVAVFLRIFWTIAFFEIIKPVRLEEAAEAGTLPEVAN